MRVNKRALMAEVRSGTGETSAVAYQDLAKHNTRAAMVLLSTPEAAVLVEFSAITLKRYRSKGGGPRFLRLGRSIRYTRTDLLEWALGRRQ